MTTSKPTLAAKLASITGQMQHVPKNGFNKAQNYPFVRETDVAEKLSALLAEANIFLHQTVLSKAMRELYRTERGMTMWLTEVDVQFTWIDGDTGDRLDAAVFPGSGADTGDKGLYKALTGAEKYFLMKTFLVSTGDDPEADEKVDKEAAATSASRGGRTTVTKANHGKVARGGRQALASDAQLAEVKRIAKERGVTDSAGMMTLVSDTIRSMGEDAPEWASPAEFGAYLRGLTSTALGALIVALADAPTVETVEGPQPGDRANHEDDDATEDVDVDLD